MLHLEDPPESLCQKQETEEEEVVEDREGIVGVGGMTLQLGVQEVRCMSIV